MGTAQNPCMLENIIDIVSLQSWHNRCQSILMKSLLYIQYGQDIAQQLMNNNKKK